MESVLSESTQPTMTTLRLRVREPIRSVAELARAEGLAGQQVLSMGLVRPTLEDVFVSLTNPAGRG